MWKMISTSSGLDASAGGRLLETDNMHNAARIALVLGVALLAFTAVAAPASAAVREIVDDGGSGCWISNNEVDLVVLTLHERCLVMQ